MTAAWVSVILGTYTMPVFAQQSPEFVYTAEKWETLRDNRLEYDEIADLIHEYNPTVLQNAITYRGQRDKTADDVAQEYYDAANNAYASLNIADSDAENYASSLSSYINNKKNADNLMEQGDNSTDNSETYKLTYDQAEANLVKQAQQQMISYYSQQYSLISQDNAVSQAEADLKSEENRLLAGLSTEAKVLSARQKLSSAQASLQTAQSSLNKTKENLILMLGWAYGSDVQIGALPDPDLDQISAIDLEESIAQAQENNFSLKKTMLQLSHARTEKVRDSLTTTRDSSRAAIANNVGSLLQSLQTAVSSYEQAVKAFEIQQNALETAERKKAAGTITPNTYQNTLFGWKNAEVTMNTKRLAILTAYVDFQWAVKGLAAVN